MLGSSRVAEQLMVSRVALSSTKLLEDPAVLMPRSRKRGSIPPLPHGVVLRDSVDFFTFTLYTMYGIKRLTVILMVSERLHGLQCRPAYDIPAMKTICFSPLMGFILFISLYLSLYFKSVSFYIRKIVLHSAAECTQCEL
jgi:hypothetical protein